MKSRLLLVVAVAGASVAATSAIAWAGGSSSPAHPQPANTHRTFSAATALDTSTESKYTPIAPCRAVNTAAAGAPLRDGSHKLYFIGGTTGFSTQGGHSGGCGVPVDATAVTATITATASGRGYLKVWGAGTTEPTTSFMNYTSSFLVSVGGTARLGSEGRIAVRNHAGPRISPSTSPVTT